MNYMFQPFKKYADFQGRARRAEYWQFYLLYIIVYVVSMSLVAMTRDSGAGQMLSGLLVLAAMLGFIVPMIAVSFRRLHDVNRSAWWLLIALVPLIGGIVLLVFTCTAGTVGANRFGADPKGHTDEVFA